MAATMNPAAPHHLPVFITAPGETDAFMYGCAIFLVLAVFGLGTVYFRLHALPEQMAHRNASKLQFEVVAVLALLGLLTHTTAFWVAALLLALVPIPDFHGPLHTMADSLARIAGLRRDRPDDVATVAEGRATPLSADPSPLVAASELPPEPQESEPVGHPPIRAV